MSASDAGVTAIPSRMVEWLRHRAAGRRIVIVGDRPATQPAVDGIRWAGAGVGTWGEVLCPDGGSGVALIHDAARPLAAAGVLTALESAIREGAGVAAAVSAVTDTIKVRTADGLLLSTVDRSQLRHVHSPWACAAGLLSGAVESDVEGLLWSVAARSGSGVHGIALDPAGEPA